MPPLASIDLCQLTPADDLILGFQVSFNPADLSVVLSIFWFLVPQAQSPLSKWEVNFSPFCFARLEVAPVGNHALQRVWILKFPGYVLQCDE